MCKLKPPKKLHNVNWLEYEQLKSALPQLWISIVRDQWNSSNFELKYDQMRRSSKVSKEVYQLLIQDDMSFRKYGNWWESDGLEIDYKKYQKSFENVFHCTKIPKLRDFQYRLLLNKIVTNQDLKTWGLKNNENCTFCRVGVESTRHLLFSCTVTTEILEVIWTLCKQNNIQVNRDKSNYILNSVHDKVDHIINFIVLFTKQLLYRYRCKGKVPTKRLVIREIMHQHDIDYAVAKQECRVNQHKKRWSPVIKF